MEIEVKTFDEILAILDDRGIEHTEAAFIAVLMRKPARATVFKEWLATHPEATDEEIGDQANIIAQTVEPTRHGMPKNK